MALHRSRYRLVGLDGLPHPVLDAHYDTLETALDEARSWCAGQGAACALAGRGIAVEVRTGSGNWRTIDYPVRSMKLPLAPSP